MTEIRYTEEEIGDVARRFVNSMGDDTVFLFEGEMGAGKTTFISEVCRALGAGDDVGSPSFSLVNEYVDGEGKSLYHFDLYRIKNAQEVFDIGTEEYLDSGNICFIEWPDRLGQLEPEESRTVEIRINDDGSRTIVF